MADLNFPINNIKHQIKTKGMWAGGLKPEKIKNLYGINDVNNLVLIEGDHAPAMHKCIDEIIANASDHCSNPDNKYPVTEIKVNISKNGLISVYNDGPSVPVALHRQGSELRKREVYIPEIIFNETFAGSSDADRKKETSKASVNSLGAKICNVHSTIFELDISDSESKLNYSQRFNHDVPEIPIITPYTKEQLANLKKVSHTKITFMLNFADFGFTADIQRVIDELFLWIKYRMFLTAAYLGSDVNVYFNDVLCPCKSSKMFIETLFKPTSAEFEYNVEETRIVSPEYKNYIWDTAIIVYSDESIIPKIVKNTKLKTLTMVNGVITLEGNHIDLLVDRIKTDLKNVLEQNNITPSDIMKNMIIVMMCKIKNPDWSEQSKNKLSVDKKQIASYNINEKFIKHISGLLITPYLAKLDAKANKVEKSKKYIKANKSGTKLSHKCTLILGEGDSALGSIKKGLAVNVNCKLEGAPNTDYYGTFSLQGVILNVAKEMDIIELPNGTTLYNKSREIRENKRLNQLRLAMNLRYDYTYESQEELATLNYGKILICTDEDLDGVGKIAPLVLVYFYYCWPALFKHGIIYRMKTPLIRVYKQRGKEYINFFNEYEYREWAEKRIEGYKAPLYFKGLGTHEEHEVKDMFKLENFNNLIFKYIVDENTKEYMHIYFGDESDRRKKVLSTPLEELPLDFAKMCQQQHIINITREQLAYNSKAYKKDAIKRQIPHIIDGLVVTKRKVVASENLLKYEDKVKVCIFTNKVMEKQHYHHGDSSISNTITLMGQGYINGKNIPLVVPSGDFGSRHGDPPASARYIDLRKSRIPSALFVPLDDKILTYNFDDGVQVEPVYYVPIVPYSILEYCDAVSEGWKSNVIPRDINDIKTLLNAYFTDPKLKKLSIELHDVINILESTRKNIESEEYAIAQKNYIEKLTEIKSNYYELSSESAINKYKLCPELKYFKGEVRRVRDKLYSFANYTITESGSYYILKITELPYRVETNSYLEKLQEEKTDKDGKPVQNPHALFYSDIHTHNTIDSVNIEIFIKRDQYDAIFKSWGDEFKSDGIHFGKISDSQEPYNPHKHNTAIEHCFRLYHIMQSTLNFYSPNDTILEFDDNYLAALLYWIKIREEFYELRIKRGIVVLELKIDFYENIIRFMDIASKIKFTDIRDEAIAIQTLEEHKFKRFNTKFFNGGCEGDIKELYKLAFEDPNYDYLINLHFKDLFGNERKKYEKSLESFKIALDEHKKLLSETPIAKSQWIKEINNFCDYVENGRRNNWLSFD